MILLLTGTALAGMGEPPTYGLVRIDQAEWVPTQGGLALKADAFWGGDLRRLWIITEGSLLREEMELALQLLGSRLIRPWWEIQAGVRLDVGEDDVMPWGVVGLEGLAPYWFEVTPQLFIGPAGLAGRLTAERDVFLTQRLIAAPEVELEAGTGWDGSTTVEARLDLRLRYEIVRELAPYISAGWSLSSTAPLDAPDVAVGVRAWF